jgi:hypothetical protein
VEIDPEPEIQLLEELERTTGRADTLVAFALTEAS